MSEGNRPLRREKDSAGEVMVKLWLELFYVQNFIIIKFSPRVELVWTSTPSDYFYPDVCTPSSFTSFCVPHHWPGSIATTLCHGRSAYSSSFNLNLFVVVTSIPRGPNYPTGKRSLFFCYLRNHSTFLSQKQRGGFRGGKVAADREAGFRSNITWAGLSLWGLPVWMSCLHFSMQCVNHSCWCERRDAAMFWNLILWYKEEGWWKGMQGKFLSSERTEAPASKASHVPRSSFKYPAVSWHWNKEKNQAS